MPSRYRLAARGAASGAILFLAAVAPGAWAASGRDLAFGYEWRDSNGGAVYRPLTPDTFNPRNPADDSPPERVALPITFPFYGVDYGEAWISDNGWISFLDPAGDAHPAPGTIPGGAGPATMLAAFGTDLDCSDPANHLLNFGPVPSIGGWMVSWTCQDPGTPQRMNADIILFPDGRIAFQYAGTLAIGPATIGIENAPADDGIQIAAEGIVFPGVAIGPQHAFEFFPPSVLWLECPSVPATGCGRIAGNLPGAMPGNIVDYSCDARRFLAQEQVYSFTLTEASRFDATLTGTPNMRLFLMEECSERSCMRAPSVALSVPLGPGTYYLSVDALPVGEVGPFTLDVACTPLGRPLACGDPASSTTIGGTMLWTGYPCAAGRLLDGPEAVYSMDVASATNLRARLVTGGPILDLVVLRAGPGEITPADCVAWGDDNVVVWDAQPGQYLLVVDGLNGASADFDLTTDCSVALDCSATAGTVVATAGSVQTVLGDTTDAGDDVQVYACDPAVIHDGPDLVYELVLPVAGQVAVIQVSGPAGLQALLLDACNEGACVGSACGTSLPAGTYYLVVDGTGAAAGPFELSVVYEETFNRWDACEDPLPPTTFADTSRSTWDFTDGAFCISQPASHNHPNGCTFAMYLTARCGTELHVPLYDVEGGHLRIFDVFRGEYVVLDALSTGGWSDSGTEIQWQDSDCVNGDDTRWNNKTTDISFRRPEGLCGVYRLEFINHSGFVWELYSNCTGDRQPGFNIHDSLCTALADYDPLANLAIESATATYDCPEITVTYTLRNDGCRAVQDFEVELTDAGQVVAVDLVDVPAGGTVTQSFTTTFPGMPTNGVELRIDPQDLTLECTEAVGAACGATTGAELVFLPECADSCQVLAQATATPSRTCVGGTVTIEAGTSTASLCPSGLEFQLRGGDEPGGWQSSSTFPGVDPTATTNYDVDVRCVDDVLCTDTVRVVVTVDQLPTVDPLAVVGADVSPCALGIRLSWTPASFPSGSGGYTLYRSQVSCAEALTNPDFQLGLTATSYDDTSTTGEATYFYVLEAEDGAPNTTCVPRGPRNNGSVRRVDFSQGTCAGITDRITPRPDLLPRVGTSLRVGEGNGGLSPTYGPTFADLHWGTDRPLTLPAGEHFHLLRSTLPDSGFTRLVPEPPLLTNPLHTDYTAVHPTSPHVYFYLVFTVDQCENDNQAFDSFRNPP